MFFTETILENLMGKVRCVKDFKCEVCGRLGMLQILSEKYARVRHYKCMKDGKPVFEYHKQNMEYAKRTLGEKLLTKLVKIIMT